MLQLHLLQDDHEKFNMGLLTIEDTDVLSFLLLAKDNRLGS